ncbi:MAG TPA: sigma factor-like helix-turn-helix DNA-binding protein [Candidatus Acidoferrum sp.]|nr:sigma factor-like helix-turn-helix DNA-binding protein [Candidatus Acidoferrum sp.]
MKPHDIVEILIQADGPVCARDLLEVSLHLPRRGTRWIASFRDETGRQVWRSTGLCDHRAALVLAREWETAAKQKRTAQRAAPPKLSIRVRPGSAARQRGCLSQKEVGIVLRISERAVREIERRAIEKLRRNPILKGLWRECKTGEIEEATSQGSRPWTLSRAEIASVYGLARSPTEREAVRKLMAMAQSGT